MTEYTSMNGELSDFASLASFGDFSVILSKVQAKRSKVDKEQVLTSYFKVWREQKADFFPMLRLLLPQLDRTRSEYGMKERKLADAYIKVLSLSQDSTDAQSLLNYKNPGKAEITGSFPDVLQKVLTGRTRTGVKTSLTIAQVNEKLDELCRAEDTDGRVAVIRFFHRNTNPKEQYWIIRIILRDALQKYQLTADLKLLSRELIDPSIRMTTEEKQVNVFKPFLPQLSDRVRPDQVAGIMKGKPFWIETKYDGERIQMHLKNGELKWFSRNSTDYTYFYGNKLSPNDGAMAPYMINCFPPNLKSVVLDGEMMAYNTVTKTFDPFGSLKTAANDVLREGDNAERHPCFMVFDILYYNGEPTGNYPLKERRQLLEKVIRPNPFRVELCPYEIGSCTTDAQKALDEHMLRCEEGIIIKNPEGPYLLDDRSGWFKIKPEYIDELSETVDLIIVGGFYGSGNRRGNLSSFLCALRDRREIDTEDSYVTVCKIGSGMRIQDLPKISKINEGNWKRFDKNHCPAWLRHPANGDTPDMIIHPKHSRVVAVKASEIIPSPSYGAGNTLRFPRFYQLRNDKDITNSMSLTEFNQFLLLNRSKMQTFGSSSQPLSQPYRASPQKRKKPISTARPQPTLLKTQLGANVSHVALLDKLFEGLRFSITPFVHSLKDITDTAQVKNELEKMVHQHGGHFLQNPVPGETDFVVADFEKLKIKNLIRGGRFDILKSQYIVDCIAAKSRIPLSSKYFLFATPDRDVELLNHEDVFGDSYEEALTLDEVKLLFERVEQNQVAPWRNSTISSRLKCPANDIYSDDDNLVRHLKRVKTISEIESRYFEPCEGSLFRECIFFFDVYNDTIRLSDDLLKLVSSNDGLLLVTSSESVQEKNLDLIYEQLLARTHGGTVVDAVLKETTHIVTISKSRAQLFRLLITRLPIEQRPAYHIVSPSWLCECNQSHTRVPEDSFAL